ncbi:MAG: DUF255 domain-containing protein, partial [Phycisphaerales bacterium]|nr:DUF255 domain-containing protein [Phycisphaerales bacterium]
MPLHVPDFSRAIRRGAILHRRRAIDAAGCALALMICASGPADPSTTDKKATMTSTNPAATAPAHTNRLIRATSPYLLQHAYNPVDWYPWGDEAF